MRREIEVKITSSGPTEVDLTDMNIADAEVGEIVAAIKMSHPDVVNILFQNNQISDSGAMVLGKELMNLSKLSFLDLQFNQLSEPGISAILMLKTNHPGITIALHGNKISNTNEMHKIEETIGMQPKR